VSSRNPLTRPCSGLALLKILAICTMLADHIHLLFFERQLEWLYWLSRLVFPLFALIIAHNLEHHRANPRRYVLRLVAYGVIAQPFYLMAFTVPQLNVLFTLASSIGVWWLLAFLKTRGVHLLLRYSLAFAIASSLPFLEFGSVGVLAVPVYAALLRRGAWWDWLAVFALAFGIVGFTSPWVMPMIAVGLWMLASRLPPHEPKKPNRFVQHAAYAFYPVHLAAIVVFSRVLP
jgi:TraX protein